MCAQSLAKAVVVALFGWAVMPFTAAASDGPAAPVIQSPPTAVRQGPVVVNNFISPLPGPFLSAPRIRSAGFGPRGSFIVPYGIYPTYGYYDGLTLGQYFDEMMEENGFIPTYLERPPYLTGYSPSLGNTGWGRAPYTQTPDLPPLPPPPVAELTVQVPADAQVWIDGQPMQQTGPVRDFVTPPLDPGRTYEYEVKASWVQNGKLVTDTQNVTFRAGDTPAIAFVQGPTVINVQNPKAAATKPYSKAPATKQNAKDGTTKPAPQK